MSMFTDIARNATVLSPLMEGRDKISTAEIIATYPNGITMTQFDILNGEKGTFPVYTIAEDDKVFAFGGAVINKIVEAIVAQFNGSVDDASSALRANGGIKLRLSQGRTRGGNNVTLVDVLD